MENVELYQGSTATLDRPQPVLEALSLNRKIGSLAKPCIYGNLWVAAHMNQPFVQN